MEDYGPSNWGRWGADDQCGTTNLITPEVTLAALSLPRTGEVLTLGVEVGPESPVFPNRDRTVHIVRYLDGRPTGYADDLLVLNTHSGTHLDGLSHNFLDGTMYNGASVAESVSSFGVTRNSIENVGGMITRGVLLDIARHRGVPSMEVGEVIHADELDECAARQGVALRSGDVVLVRTGWIQWLRTDRARFDSGEPGLSVDVAGWFHTHEVVALGCDTGAVDVLPGEEGVRPFGLHPRIIHEQGGYLIEYLDLTELASRERYEFLLMIAPLRISGGCGSPINPLVVL